MQISVLRMPSTLWLFQDESGGRNYIGIEQDKPLVRCSAPLRSLQTSARPSDVQIKLMQLLRNRLRARAAFLRGAAVLRELHGAHDKWKSNKILTPPRPLPDRGV
jgi:hypothetical protein